MRLKKYYDFILFAVYAVQSNISYSKNLNIVFKIMMYDKRKMSMTYCRVAKWIQVQ